jgi:hypothetical protein
MTAQITDTIIYAGKEYSIIGILGIGIPSPQDFGMEPASMHTACWRGFVSKYEIVNDVLYFAELTLNEQNNEYKPINGVLPETEISPASAMDLR